MPRLSAESWIQIVGHVLTEERAVTFDASINKIFQTTLS